MDEEEELANFEPLKEVLGEAVEKEQEDSEKNVSSESSTKSRKNQSKVVIKKTRRRKPSLPKKLVIQEE